ncbi:MAG: hypothetical protein ACI35W_07535 [Anaeroplasmataceae bacterium]
MYNADKMLEFVDSLAKGIDPKTGEILNDDTIINRSDVIRMLYSIKEFIKENNKVKKGRIPFALTDTTDLYEKTITISQFVRKINEKNVTGNMKKLSYKAILAWLLKKGYLEIVGKNSKLATEKGYKTVSINL